MASVAKISWMADTQCPYCGVNLVLGYKSRDSAENVKGECGNCKKSFVYNVEFFAECFAHRADCLNGKECLMDNASKDTFRGVDDQWFAINVCNLCGNTSEPFQNGYTMWRNGTFWRNGNVPKGGD